MKKNRITIPVVIVLSLTIAVSASSADVQEREEVNQTMTQEPDAGVSIEENVFSGAVSGLKQDMLKENGISVDMSQFTLTKPSADAEKFQEDYKKLLEEMEKQGFGQRSEVEVKKNEGYSLNAMELFDKTYGDLFPNGLQLGSAEIPDSFDVKSMFASASAERDNAYASVINSEAFQSVKNSISTGNLAEKYASIGNFTLPSKEELWESLGVNDKNAFLSETTGFDSLKKEYVADDNEITGNSQNQVSHGSRDVIFSSEYGKADYGQDKSDKGSDDREKQRTS